MSKKTTPVSVRLAPEDKRRIYQWAAAAGISVSEYFRREVFGSAEAANGEKSDGSKQVDPDKRKRRS